MVVSSSDFFIAPGGSDWFAPAEPERLDRDRLEALIEQPESDEPDAEIALALMDVVRDDLTASGTGGGQSLPDDDMRLAIRALGAVTERVGLPFKLPFRDHTTWRAWWNRNGGHGSWQARRELLSGLFDETYEQLVEAQNRGVAFNLVEAVSPHRSLGWPEVDLELHELRRQFTRATTPQDCAAVGLVAVRVTEALSRRVYVHAEHGASGEPEPKVADTKRRLGAFIASKLPGSGNEEVRRLAKTTIEVAQAMKHRGTPSRVEAGIAADAVLLLANILRRLHDETAGGTG